MEIIASIQDLIREDEQLASLPEIFFQVREVIEDPGSSFFDVSEIISRDPDLTCHLLKIVNSAFYGFPSRITTISHAIGIVGLDQLSDLVLSTVVIDRFRKFPDAVIDMQAFWEHSLACGLAARIIASYKNELTPERFFVAGLLHDIGHLAICLKAPEQALEAFDLSKSEDCLLHIAEAEVLGFDHAAVGDTLLKAWNLPEIYAEATAHHHKPGEANTNSLAASVIHVADIVAEALDKGIDRETFIPRLDEDALELSQVGENIFISTIMRGVVTRFQEAARIFL